MSNKPGVMTIQEEIDIEISKRCSQLNHPRQHPIVNALIETLPPQNTVWPAAARAAWLKMMGDAFTMAYPLADGEEPKAKRGRPPTTKSGELRMPIRAFVEPPFYIDTQGYARRSGGNRVFASEVAGVLVDLRGEMGDLGEVVWADDTRGIPKGVHLDITIAEYEK